MLKSKRPRTKRSLVSRKTATNSNSNMDKQSKVKIKRVKRNKKPITTKQKIMAGFGLAGAVLGGLQTSANKPQNTVIVSTNSKDNTNGKKSNSDKIKDLITNVFGVPKAHADSFGDSGYGGGGGGGGGDTGGVSNGGYGDGFGGDTSGYGTNGSDGSSSDGSSGTGDTSGSQSGAGQGNNQDQTGGDGAPSGGQGTATIGTNGVTSGQGQDGQGQATGSNLTSGYGANNNASPTVTPTVGSFQNATDTTNPGPTLQQTYGNGGATSLTLIGIQDPNVSSVMNTGQQVTQTEVQQSQSQTTGTGLMLTGFGGVSLPNPAALTLAVSGTDSSGATQNQPTQTPDGQTLEWGAGAGSITGGDPSTSTGIPGDTSPGATNTNQDPTGGDGAPGSGDTSGTTSATVGTGDTTTSPQSSTQASSVVGNYTDQAGDIVRVTEGPAGTVYVSYVDPATNAAQSSEQMSYADAQALIGQQLLVNTDQINGSNSNSDTNTTSVTIGFTGSDPSSYDNTDPATEGTPGSNSATVTAGTTGTSSSTIGTWESGPAVTQGLATPGQTDSTPAAVQLQTGPDGQGYVLSSGQIITDPLSSVPNSNLLTDGTNNYQVNSNGTLTYVSYDYTVQAGDSLWKIANENGITVEQLGAANGIADPNTYNNGTVTIHPGDTLVIPDVPATYGPANLNAPIYGPDAPVTPPSVAEAPGGGGFGLGTEGVTGTNSETQSAPATVAGLIGTYTTPSGNVVTVTDTGAPNGSQVIVTVQTPDGPQGNTLNPDSASTLLNSLGATLVTPVSGAANLSNNLPQVSSTGVPITTWNGNVGTGADNQTYVVNSSGQAVPTTTQVGTWDSGTSTGVTYSGGTQVNVSNAAALGYTAIGQGVYTNQSNPGAYYQVDGNGNLQSLQTSNQSPANTTQVNTTQSSVFTGTINLPDGTGLQISPNPRGDGTYIITPMDKNGSPSGPTQPNLTGDQVQQAIATAATAAAQTAAGYYQPGDDAPQAPAAAPVTQNPSQTTTSDIPSGLPAGTTSLSGLASSNGANLFMTRSGVVIDGSGNIYELNIKTQQFSPTYQNINNPK